MKDGYLRRGFHPLIGSSYRDAMIEKFGLRFEVQEEKSGFER